MNRYQCHKIVQAAKVVDIGPYNDEGSRSLALDNGDSVTVWRESQFKNTEIGDYYVVYTDGYASVSPSEAFEAGYRLLRDGDMSFGGAIIALKAGMRVARAGWNGKGMWLSLSCGETRDVPAAGFWSPHNAQHAIEQGGTAKVLPSITMKTATGEILMGWLASQTDMLADDWLVVT